MTIFEQIIHQPRLLEPPKVVHGPSIYRDTASVASVYDRTLKSAAECDKLRILKSLRPMKLFLLDQDLNSQHAWSTCAESLGTTFQLTRYGSIPESLSQEAGIVVVDRSACGQDFATQIERICRLHPRQQIIATGELLKVELVVDLMMAGAVAICEKPFNIGRLVSVMPAVIRRANSTILKETEYIHLITLFSSLTTRERQVLDMVLDGVHNRESAEQLGVSVRTVEARRAKVYRKLECNNIVELVKKIERLERLKRELDQSSESDSNFSSMRGHHWHRPAMDVSNTSEIE